MLIIKLILVFMLVGFVPTQPKERVVWAVSWGSTQVGGKLWTESLYQAPQGTSVFWTAIPEGSLYPLANTAKVPAGGLRSLFAIRYEDGLAPIALEMAKDFKSKPFARTTWNKSSCPGGVNVRIDFSPKLTVKVSNPANQKNQKLFRVGHEGWLEVLPGDVIVLSPDARNRGELRLYGSRNLADECASVSWAPTAAR